MNQFELPMKPDMVDVDPKVLDNRATMTGAIVLCADMGGLEPKQLAGTIVKDAESWSRIKGGTQFFPQDKLCALMDLAGNEAPLFWLARRRGYVLTAMETELERQLRLTQEARQRAEDENKLLRGLLVGRGA